MDQSPNEEILPKSVNQDTWVLRRNSHSEIIDKVSKKTIGLVFRNLDVPDYPWEGFVWYRDSWVKRGKYDTKRKAIKAVWLAYQFVR